jgi:hypothetical protein
VSQLIDFYSGAGADHRGRRLDEILAWDDERLEQTHDYIQWLFPLAAASRFNPHAPLLTDPDRAEFQKRPELRANVLRAMRRMLGFYGFSMDECSASSMAEERSGGASANPMIQFAGGGRHWLSPGDHNYLRITRILTSLRLLGLPAYADAFFTALEKLYREHSYVIGRETFAYWQNAVRLA